MICFIVGPSCDWHCDQQFGIHDSFRLQGNGGINNFGRKCSSNRKAQKHIKMCVCRDHHTTEKWKHQLKRENWHKQQEWMHDVEIWVQQELKRQHCHRTWQKTFIGEINDVVNDVVNVKQEKQGYPIFKNAERTLNIHFASHWTKCFNPVGASDARAHVKLQLPCPPRSGKVNGNKLTVKCHCKGRKKHDQWTILPVTQPESWWWSTSFRHKLARQTLSVTDWNQSRTFLWSCALGSAWCVILLGSLGADDVLRRQSWWLWRKEAVIWIFWEGVTCAVLWTMVVNCPNTAVDLLEGPVNLIKMHLSWLLARFSFVTCTCNCFGETLQLETLPQNGSNCWQLHFCWQVDGDAMNTFQTEEASCCSLTVECGKLSESCLA